MRVRLMALLIFSVASLSISIADVRLPSIFSDNMVLQADTKVPIWGWAQPNEMVSVLIGNQKHSAVADSDGKWMIKLDELKSSSSLVKMIIQGENTLTIKNVLVGQVWIGSGQSNMWWPVKYAMDPNEEISNADFPSIRLFTVGKKISLIRIVHDVPGLKMKGLKNEDLPYEIRNFTNQGWGTTVRYEFNNDKGLVVTLARFNPQAKKMLLTTATIEKSCGLAINSCNYGVALKVPDTMKVFRKQAQTGHHFSMVYGDFSQEMKSLAEIMNFEIDEI